MPPNPPSKAHGFAMLRDMQIYRSQKKKNLGPLPNPGYALEHTLESSSNEIEQRYTHRTIDNASGMCYNSSPLSKKKIYLTVEHRFLPLINDPLIISPTPPSITI